MTIKLSTISQEIWQLIKDEQSKMTQSDIPQKAGPNSLVFSTDNKDWLFKICGLHNKGKIQLILCPIPNPNTHYRKLAPLTDSDWETAFVKANQILSDLFQLSTSQKEPLL